MDMIGRNGYCRERTNEAAIFQSVNLSRVPRNVAVKAGRPDIK